MLKNHGIANNHALTGDDLAELSMPDEVSDWLKAAFPSLSLTLPALQGTNRMEFFPVSRFGTLTSSMAAGRAATLALAQNSYPNRSRSRIIVPSLAGGSSR